jgi:hypothetical protein
MKSHKLLVAVLLLILIALLVFASSDDAEAHNTEAVAAQQLAGPDERVCYPQDMDTQAGTYTAKDGEGETFTVARTSGANNARLVLIKDCSITVRFVESYGAASITWENGYPVVTSVSEGKRQGLRYVINERYGFDRVPPMFGAAALPIIIR